MKSKVMLSVLLLTCMALCLNTVPAWGTETLVETVGFESSEGYTSSTTYNSANYTTGTSGSKWTINYGAFSTSSAIVGSESAQFRVYSAGNYGQLRNTVAYEIDITKVVFNARVSNTNSSIKVSYSADGTSWTDIETVSFSGITMVEHTSTISVSGARYIKFTAAGSKPSSSNYQIYIDAVKIYTASGVTYTDNFFQQVGTHTTPTCRGKRSRYVPPAHLNKSHLHLHETPIKLVTRQCFNGSLHGF